MGTVSKILRYLKSKTEEIILLIASAILILLSICAEAQSPIKPVNGPTIKATPDTSFYFYIREQVNSNRSQSALYYPIAVRHFYAMTGYQPAWVKAGQNIDKTWQAMIMIDCVLQFGLSHNDYHPHQLLYNKLHDILETPERISNNEKVRFDFLLTDAIISLMNNLHFGKLNPDYPAGKIDGTSFDGFNAETVLLNALKRPDFMTAIMGVQPRSKQYVHLQNYMRVVAGQQVGDCYEVPDGVLKKVAINMERLRWAEINKPAYIQINIPSYTLKFHQPDTAYSFKVIVGKPINPSPSLQSAISYFTTAPEWKVPDKIFAKELLPKALANAAYLENNHFDIYSKKGTWIEPTRANLLMIKQNRNNYRATQSSGCDNALGLVVFRFPNIYDIYLHDTPEQKLFQKNERAFSHGCIRVEQAEKLAGLVLQNDNSADKIPAVHKAISTYTTKTFTLKKTLSIEVVYLTCEVTDGILTIYPDIYDLDNNLGMALYQNYPALSEVPNN
jgi:murein L,D-transpeptidase YcbB/YkuD